MSCTRCHRPITKVVVVDGKGYGTGCAAKVGDLLVQPAQRAKTTKRRRARKNERQEALFA